MGKFFQDTKDNLVDGDDFDRLAIFGRYPEELVGHAKATEGFNEAIAIYDHLLKEVAKIDGSPMVPLTKDAKKREFFGGLGKRIEALGTLRGGLAGELKSLVEQHVPALPHNDVVSAAIWPLLPDGTDLEDTVRMRYIFAVDAGEWSLCNACESMPSVFPSALKPVERAELMDYRFEKENPELHAKVTFARNAHHLVDVAADATAKILAGHVRDVGPPPEKDAPGGAGFTTQDGDVINA